MLIDAHHHLWDLAVRPQPWTDHLPALRRSFGIDELRPHLTRHGIDGTVLVQTTCVPEETPELLALAHGDDAIAGVVGWVDLTAVNVAERLAELRTLPGGERLVGVRHQVQDEPDPRWLCREDVWRGLAALADAGLTYDLLVVPAQLPAAIETVQALPQLRFVLDHAGKPAIANGVIEPWNSRIAELAAAPNVAAKLSGLVTEAAPGWTADQLRPYSDALLASFGPQRTMFGSDWPVCLLAGSYDQVIDAAQTLTAHLTDAERSAVLGETASQWYGLAA